MESVFLACLVFGALLTAVSFLAGFAGTGLGGLHLGHGGPVAHVGHAPAGGHAPAQAHAGPAQESASWLEGLPLFNASSFLAFLAWFGATGYILTHFAGWPALAAALVGVLVGAAGGVLVALFLRLLMAGEREMDPADYRIEGALARVTSGIPAGGVGEVVFSIRAGSRRSEAARSLDGRPIPRGTEVVILEYQRGIAAVQPYSELVARPAPETERTAPPAGPGA